MLDKIRSIDYRKKLKLVLEFLSIHRLIIGGVVMGAIFAITIARINSFTQPSINEERIQEQTAALKSVEFDEATITQIQTLNDSGIFIDSKFEPNRNNPFKY